MCSKWENLMKTMRMMRRAWCSTWHHTSHQLSLRCDLDIILTSSSHHLLQNLNPDSPSEEMWGNEIRRACTMFVNLGINERELGELSCHHLVINLSKSCHHLVTFQWPLLSTMRPWPRCIKCWSPHRCALDTTKGLSISFWWMTRWVCCCCNHLVKSPCQITLSNHLVKSS